MNHKTHYLVSFSPQGVVVHRLNSAVEATHGFTPDNNWHQLGEPQQHLGDAMQVVEASQAGLLDIGELNCQPGAA